MEQLPLDLRSTKEEEETLENLSTTELEQRYHQQVGKNPQLRFHDQDEEARRTILIEGIHEPEKAIERLRALDAQDDRVGEYH